VGERRDVIGRHAVKDSSPPFIRPDELPVLQDQEARLLGRQEGQPRRPRPVRIDLLQPRVIPYQREAIRRPAAAALTGRRSGGLENLNLDEADLARAGLSADRTLPDHEVRRVKFQQGRQAVS
jgi:hypothetical protein